MMAYTPTGRMDSRLKESKLLKNLAEKYNKNVTQIIFFNSYD